MTPAIFSHAIRRALQRECKSDLLGLIAPGQSLPVINRHAYARVESVLALLKRGEIVNTSAMARGMKCSRKTAERDIKYLRGQGHRITYNEKRYTYVLKPKTGDGHHS